MEGVRFLFAQARRLIRRDPRDIVTYLSLATLRSPRRLYRRIVPRKLAIRGNNVNPSAPRKIPETFKELVEKEEISKYGGVVSVMPRYAVVFMIFTLGALGLPGTTGFIGEFLILLGTFKVNFTVATIASLGVILGASYMLWLYRRIVFGEITNSEVKKLVDLNNSEMIILSVLAFVSIMFGFYPDPLLSTTSASVEGLIELFNTNIKIYTASNL